jgi:phage terminase large subunit
MSVLKKINALREEVSDFVTQKTASSYTTTRDDKGNLYVAFGDGETIKLPFIPFRPYQIAVQVKLFIEKIKRQLHEWPRRAGKEVVTWNISIEGAIEDPGLYLMIYPTNVRARAILWDGSILMPDGTSVKFLDMVPKRLISSINNQEMKIKLHNGSVLWVVGSDIDPDKLRGTNPRGVVLSEFAFQDPRVCYILLPVLRQNGGWLIGQSTFDGMNHFYQMIEHNKDNPLWHCCVESVVTLVDENGDRYVSDEMIEEDRKAGMPEYLIQQEYYGVVQINQETKYFAHAIRNIYDTNRLIANLFVPSAKIYSAFDIGMNDCTAIILFQVRRVDQHLRPVIVGYIEDNNHDLAYYITNIRRFCAQFNLVFGEHFIPHDGQKRDFNTGKNTVDFMREMGETALIVPRPASKENAIEAMRRKLYLTDFNKENTARLIDCLSNYSKEYDDKMGTYKNRPKHDWASHGVDAFQTMTLALDGEMISDRVYDVLYYAN